jgi:AbiV family abortive infection protein
VPISISDFLQKFQHGKLTSEELGRGMHLCFLNASSLVDDAELLLETSPGRALSLAILALEELGKIFILCNWAAKASFKQVDWAEVSQSIHSHKNKQEIFASYGRAILDRFVFSYKVDFPSNLSPLLDRLKQSGFYVDCFEGQFISPQDAGRDNIEWTKWIISAAKERLGSLAGLHGSEQSSILFAEGAVNILKAVRGEIAFEKMYEALTRMSTEISQISQDS